MMYTRERLMKAVRDAGRGGRPFTLGEVRGELGLKSRDKRELKRFRSRFRECSQILGDHLEKLGPNTFRLKAGFAEPLQNVTCAAPLPIKAAPQLSAKKQPAKAAAQAQAAIQAASLLERVGVPARPDEEEDLYTTKRRPREHIEFVAAQPTARGVSFGERISSWFGRTRHESLDVNIDNTTTASTALSRLAVELQPKATGFEYRWINGKLQVQRAGEK